MDYRPFAFGEEAAVVWIPVVPFSFEGLSFVVVDGSPVTSRNPRSSEATTEELLVMLLKTFWEV